jgi:hypothetical protein
LGRFFRRFTPIAEVPVGTRIGTLTTLTTNIPAGCSHSYWGTGVYRFSLFFRSDFSFMFFNPGNHRVPLRIRKRLVAKSAIFFWGPPARIDALLLSSAYCHRETSEASEEGKGKPVKKTPKQVDGAPRNPPGRPSLFSHVIVVRICDELSKGIPLTIICDAEDMPNVRTVYDWMEKDHAFSADVARATRASTGSPWTR